MALFLLNSTLKRTAEASEAANKANRIAELEMRPWLDIDLVSIQNFTMSRQAANIAVVKVENVGKSIAHNVHLKAYMYEGGTKKLEEITPIIRAVTLNWKYSGSTSLVGRPSTLNTFIDISNLTDNRSSLGDFGVVGIVILARYSNISGDDLFYTSKNYLLWHSGSMIFMEMDGRYGSGTIIPMLDSNRSTYR